MDSSVLEKSPVGNLSPPPKRVGRTKAVCGKDLDGKAKPPKPYTKPPSRKSKDEA
ncbi:hypothetical protein H4R33_006995 [Dimargaris cristalligena]|nr:hypothetical protein H4R33_006995 [Dimargaris cristalligena]